MIETRFDRILKIVGFALLVIGALGAMAIEGMVIAHFVVKYW